MKIPPFNVPLVVAASADAGALRTHIVMRGENNLLALEWGRRICLAVETLKGTNAERRRRPFHAGQLFG